MRNRTWLAALALTGCALVAGGCKPNDTANPGAAQSSGGTGVTTGSNPVDQLLAAAEPLRSTSYKFSTATGGITIQGAVNPTARTATVDVAGSIKVREVDGELYLNYPNSLPGLVGLGGSGTWLRIDPSKLAVGALGLQDASDPSGGYNYLKTASFVQKVSDKRYKGTLDLTKAPSFAANPKMLATFGDSATAVPFEVTLDQNGRPSTLDISPKVNGAEVATHTTFSDYGTQVTVTRPAPSEIADPPASFYQAFNR